MERLEQVVVADPSLEDVAEQIERVGGRRAADQPPQLLEALWVLRRQVQVGGEQDRPAALADFVVMQRRQASSSAPVMTTSSSGTSACGGRRVVRTLAMLSTTSLPSVTLPNTQ